MRPSPRWGASDLVSPIGVPLSPSILAILAILAIEFGGELDLSHLAPKWRSLLPTEAEQAELDSVRVEREEGTGSNSYASFVGEGAGSKGLIQTWWMLWDVFWMC